MKDRLLQLLDLEQLSPSKFADIIGVQRSSVSHVISGRNKPSYDFLHKTLRAFPGLNAQWLIMGEGTMYEQMGRSAPGNLFSMPESSPQDESADDNSPPVRERGQELESHGLKDHDKDLDQSGEKKEYLTEDQINKEKEPEKEVSAIASSSRKKAKVVQILLIYEDDTFRSLESSALYKRLPE